MKRVASLLALCLLALNPVAALAQDEPELQPFTSEDGQLTVSYPVDWFIAETLEALGLPGVVMTNSENALNQFLGEVQADEPTGPQEGDEAIVILLLPAEVLGFLGVTVDEDTTPEELIEGVASGFMGVEVGTADSAATPEPGMPSVGVPDVIELGEQGLEAGYVTISDQNADGAIIAFQVVEGVVALVVSQTPPGEYSEEFDQVVRDVAGTLTYAGTAEDLMNILMGGVDVGTATEEAAPEATATEAAE